MIENKKSLILLVLKTLEEFSDEDHFLTQQEIADRIYQDYGIEFERKSIGSSLAMLGELGYDVNKGPRGGFALLSRSLDRSEADFIVDAIFSSKSIAAKDAKQMAQDVYSVFSKYQRKNYSYIHKTSEISRTSNSEVLYNVSLIHEAMKRGKGSGSIISPTIRTAERSLGMGAMNTSCPHTISSITSVITIFFVITGRNTGPCRCFGSTT